jgi:hypothetical protein
MSTRVMNPTLVREVMVNEPREHAPHCRQPARPSSSTDASHRSCTLAASWPWLSLDDRALAAGPSKGILKALKAEMSLVDVIVQGQSADTRYPGLLHPLFVCPFRVSHFPGRQDASLVHSSPIGALCGRCFSVRSILNSAHAARTDVEPRNTGGRRRTMRSLTLSVHWKLLKVRVTTLFISDELDDKHMIKAKGPLSTRG